MLVFVIIYLKYIFVMYITIPDSQVFTFGESSTNPGDTVKRQRILTAKHEIKEHLNKKSTKRSRSRPTEFNEGVFKPLCAGKRRFEGQGVSRRWNTRKKEKAEWMVLLEQNFRKHLATRHHSRIENRTAEGVGVANYTKDTLFDTFQTMKKMNGEIAESGETV